MRTLHTFMRGITRFNDWLGRWVSRLLLVVFFLLMAELLFRYFAGAPKVWTAELAQMLFGVYAVLSGGYIMAHSGHANVDLLHSHFPPRLKALVDIITSMMFFAFIGGVLYFGGSMAYDSISFWEHSQSAWNPPVWPIKLMIPVGATLLLLQGIVKIMQDIATALGIEPPQGQSWHHDCEEL